MQKITTALLRAPYLSLFILQLSSWGLIFFFTEGRWWDDWILSSVPSSEYSNILMQQGVPFFAITYGFMGTWPLFWVTLIGFLSWNIASICWSKITIRLGLLSKNQSFIVAAICLTIPLFDSRILKCITAFQISIALFMAGWFVFLYSSNRLGIARFIVATMLITLSFTTASLIAFSAVPLILIWKQNYEQTKTFRKNLAQYLLTTLSVFFIPLGLWYITRILFPQNGLYKNYNIIGTGLENPKNIVFLSTLIVLFLVSSIWILLGKLPQFLDNKYQTVILGTSILAITSGLIPYAAVGKIPVIFSGLDSRFQALLPFGTSLLVVWLYLQVRKRNVSTAKYLLTSFILICILISNALVLRYWIDYEKQKSIIEFISTNKSQLNGYNLFVISDETAFSPVGGHDKYNFYEISGWLEEIFSGRAKLGVENSNNAIQVATEFIENKPIEKFGARNFTIPISMVDIEITSEFKNNVDILKRLIAGKPLFSVETN